MPTLTLQSWGDEVLALQQNLAQLGQTIPMHEMQEKTFGVGTQKALLTWQEASQLPMTGTYDEATQAALQQALSGAAVMQSRVEGRILTEQGQAATGLPLRLYLQTFGGGSLLLNEAATDEKGFYFLPYTLETGTPANIELRAVDAEGKEIPLTGVKFGAAKRELMNLVAPASLQVAATEFQRLSGDLTAKLGDFAKIGEAKEDEGQQDLSLLREATGWDARLLALGSKAVQMSAATGIGQEASYGLLRAGLPADGNLLATLHPDTVELALQKTVETGVTALSEADVAAAKGAFQGFAAQLRLQEKAPGTLSSVGEMLAKSGLDANESAVFENVYFQERGNGAKIWEEALAQGLDPAKVDGLRLQGKLAFLTLNNAELTASLQTQVGSTENLASLVDMDYHKPETWEAQLKTLANDDPDALDKLIPPAYGGSLGERLQAYATDRAQLVRSSYPTQVVGRMVETGELHLGEAHEELKTPVHTFLRNATAAGLAEKFEMGSTPVEAFFRNNEAQLMQGIEPGQAAPVLEEVKTLHRLYQITPNDTAMQVLKNEGFSSAFEVTAYSYEDFLQYFAGKFQSKEEASVVYKKAEQVTTVVHGFYTTARQVDSPPPIFAMSPPPQERQAAKDRLIKQYPTMEKLFGSLDFCECEHCRSVLSPAAYFVDLLQFIDIEKGVWERFLADWRKRHEGAAYPHLKPFDALMQRRPDLQHLPLTCENTHTALPYIDVVNEILEYFIVHQELNAGAAHDTGSATTPELLAEPQNILPEAYRILANARYPLSLPFDLWLETSREWLAHLGLPLWKLMEMFNASEDLFPPAGEPLATGAGYVRAAIFAEQLGLSPAEEGLLCPADPLANWHESYGFPDPFFARMMLMVSAKHLSRQLGVSYKELAQLVQTRFLNPQLEHLETLRKAGLSVADVFRYKAAPGYEPLSSKEQEAFEQRLGQLTVAFTPEGGTASFDARAWLEETWSAGGFFEVLVLADPIAGCSFELTKFQKANGNVVEDFDYFKINVFVRLWRKLGWTIEELDHALLVFLPKNSLPLVAANFGEAMRSALLGIAHFAELERRLKLGKNSRIKLLTLWADLPTRGKNSLYAQLFLTRSVLKNSPVFDDPMGNYLSTPGILLQDHLAALRSALGLSEADIRGILEAEGLRFDTTELSLALVSKLYRYGLLAKALKLPMQDFLILKSLSEVNPFRSLHPDPVSSFWEDVPWSAMLRFVESAEVLRNSEFKAEEINYLLRHRYDPQGKLAPKEADFLALAGQMAAAFPDDEARIQAIASQKGADPALMDALLRHLRDPAEAGLPLLETFKLAEGQSVSAAWAASGDALVGRLRNAHVLLEKALRLASGFGLNGREFAFFQTDEEEFEDFNLSVLPFDEAGARLRPDISKGLFQQVLRLAEYARLRSEMAGGSDALIGVFEKTRQVHPVADNISEAKKDLLDRLFAELAALTRRDAALVRATANALGFKANSKKISETERLTEAPDFATLVGLGRFWQVLQAAARTGMPVESLARWATPLPTHETASELKNTVKGSYEPGRWQSVAQPIFDRLRQRQRDALVAHIKHTKGFASTEELFEHFLIDPGMEPVVQTSRLRLGISSLQLFVQRCLLNLELQVHPSAIVNARHWQWMKRYRVWEANRKIFLYPENWLEPEFRDDKSHLFRELEGALLQGDVSKDLAEDAFFQYLKKMEELARLEIVTMYIEESPTSNILHVVGRTYGEPHRYFYRRYARQMWTPWEPISADIEGDHLTAVVWRERLHLFWLSFLEKPRQAEPSSKQKKAALTEVKLGDIAEAPTKMVEVQLNWSEYYQGQWTTKEAGGFGRPVTEEVPMDFDKKGVFIHASTDRNEGEESVLIHLHFDRVISRGAYFGQLKTGVFAVLGREARNLQALTTIGSREMEISSGAPQITTSSRAFRIYTKNSPPEPNPGAAPPVPPLRASRSGPTHYAGSGSFANSYVRQVVQVDNQAPVATTAQEDILRSGNSFVILPPSNAALLPDPTVAALTSPFFYMDRRHTFLVEPTLVQTTIDKWEEWTVTKPAAPGGSAGGGGLGWIEKIPIVPSFPKKGWDEPWDGGLIDPGALLKVQPKVDWLTNDFTSVSFGDRVVSEKGGLSMSQALQGSALSLATANPMSGSGLSTGTDTLSGLATVSGASGILAGQTTVVESAVTAGGGLSVVGSHGLNAAVLDNLSSVLSGGFGGLNKLKTGGFGL